MIRQMLAMIFMVTPLLVAESAPAQDRLTMGMAPVT
jgi:hypothetical protein